MNIDQFTDDELRAIYFSIENVPVKGTTARTIANSASSKVLAYFNAKKLDPTKKGKADGD